MKRRGFLSRLGLGAAIAVTPIVVKAKEKVVKEDAISLDGIPIYDTFERPREELIWPKFMKSVESGVVKANLGPIASISPCSVRLHYLTYVPFHGKYFVVRQTFNMLGTRGTKVHFEYCTSLFQNIVYQEIDVREKTI